MSKNDFKELIQFARENNLMNKPLIIVIQRFQIHKGSAT